MVLELVLEREIDCQPLKRKTRFGFHFYVIHGTKKEKDYQRNYYHSRWSIKMAGKNDHESWPWSMTQNDRGPVNIGLFRIRVVLGHSTVRIYDS